MASGKGKGSWIIWVVIIIALGLVALSFVKEKPASVKAPAQDVLADKAKAPAPATLAGSTAAIKAAHSTEEQAAIAAIKVKPAVIVPPQVVLPREIYAVQVYSFKDKVRADTALAKLQAKGYKAYIMVSDLGARGIWYRVRVGTFSNEEDAKKALESVVTDFRSGIIVTE